MYKKIIVLALLLCLVCFSVSAEISTALVRGTIYDSKGAVVPNVSITIRNLETGVTESTSSNEAGIYQLLDLQVGNYELTAVGEHFAKTVRSGITLRVGDQVRTDVTLQPESRQDVVEVTESTPVTQTETSTSFTVINERAIQELPNDGRQLQNLVLESPGVDAGGKVTTAADRYGKAREGLEGAFSIDGARTRANNFLFDGMPMDLREYGVINFEPSNESVQEFSVINSAPPAEFGGTMGGQINIVTRAGSDHYHGSLYEFFRNNVLNANDTFTKEAHQNRPEVRHNQFGGTFSGPLDKKNKNFLFFNGEVLRNLEASETVTGYVPTDDERTGKITYTDSYGATKTATVNVVPISARLLTLYPEPNTTVSAGNYTIPETIQMNDYQGHLRTDHHLTEKDTVTFRTSWNLNDQVYIVDRWGGPYIPGFPLPNPEQTWNYTGGYYHTFSPSIVNEARLGLNYYRNPMPNGDKRSAAAWGLPNGATAEGLPYIDLGSNINALGGLSWYDYLNKEIDIHFADSISVLRGRHSMKLGGTLDRFQTNTRGIGNNERGTITFSADDIASIFSGLDIPTGVGNNDRTRTLANFLTGHPSEASITTGQFGRGYRQWTWALFAQDNWRVSRKLTIDYGIRYDYTTVWTEVHNKLSNYVPGTGLITPSSSSWHGLYRPDRNNFAPRLGFSYDILGTGRTVMRGGFGVLYETLQQANLVAEIESNPPFVKAADVTDPTAFPTTNVAATTLTDIRASASASTNIAAIAQNLPNPYNIQFYFGVQQALAKTWLLDISYHGSHGVHLPMNYNINQVQVTAAEKAEVDAAVNAGTYTTSIVDKYRLDPNYKSINYFTNTASSIYHSLQVKVEHHVSKGLNVLAAYTYSRSIDNASDYGSSDSSEHVLNSFNLRAQRAASSFDVPHRLTIAFNYDVPSFAWKHILEGWQLNGVVTVMSGQPYTPYSDNTLDHYRAEWWNWLTVVSDPHRNVPKGYAVNPAAYAAPTDGTFGTSGRNSIRSAYYKSADLSVFRNFGLTSHLKLQTRLEATNAFNNINYTAPNTDLSTSLGAYSKEFTRRTVQLGAKLTY